MNEDFLKEISGKELIWLIETFMNQHEMMLKKNVERMIDFELG